MQVLGCAVCLPSSLNPPLWRPWGHHSEACLLSVPRAAAAFLPLSFIKQKKMQWCLCVLQRRKMLSDRLFSGLKWMGWAQRSELNGKRGRGSICPPVCFDSFSLAYRMCWVRGEQKLRNALLLSLSASLGSGGGEWEGRRRHTASFLFLLLNPLQYHHLHFGDSYCSVFCITVNWPRNTASCLR